MPRILKKDLEARIVELERQVAIATEFLIETVRTAKDWEPADRVLRKMDRMPVVADPNCRQCPKVVVLTYSPEHAPMLK